MKIDKKIRDSYANQHAACLELQKEVEKIRGLLDARWHYEARLKSEESFALKVEAGLFRKDLVIDDFFACTIVVGNYSEIARAVALATDQFTFLYRRPKDDVRTNISPTDFKFGDLRMYFRLKPPEYLPTGPLHKITFEVQIKTFLQHAWAIATHDLTYKTDAISWAKTRIAHQIRAMLEHAELSIEQVEALAKSTSIAKEFPDYEELANIIATLKKHWPPERLPRDLLRLAQNTRDAIRAFNIQLNELDLTLDDEKKEGRGSTIENLSPYGTIMQTILNRFTSRILDAKTPERKITISGAVELPSAIPRLNDDVFRVI